jgi:hypothetical protein
LFQQLFREAVDLAGLASGGDGPRRDESVRYESVSFYLPDSQVRVFGYGQKRELICHLENHPDALVLVKSGPVYEALVRDLPAGVRLDTRERGIAVTVGRVVHRPEVAPRNLAHLSPARSSSISDRTASAGRSGGPDQP